MTTMIQLCGACLRYFADGQPVRLHLSEQVAARREGRVDYEFVCGQADCAAVVAERAERDKARRRPVLKPRLERQEGRAVCRAARPGGASLPVGRMPYKDDDLEGSPASLAAAGRSGEPLTTAVGPLVERALSQEDFKASGAADSQNAKLLEFFSAPHHFGEWVRSTELEALSGATRMNNRAVDLRPEFIKRGFYIDNAMIRPAEGAPAASHYRVCRIEDAVSLSEEQKAELLRGVV